MTRISRTRSTAIVLSLLIAVQTFAADSGQWSNLGILNRGDRVGIVHTNQARTEGRFQSYTDSAITIQADREVLIPRQDVVRVYRRAGMRRLNRALLGAAAGIAAGAILSGTVGDRFRNEGADAPAAQWIGGGAAIGAAIGALTGSGYREVCRIRQP